MLRKCHALVLLAGILLIIGGGEVFGQMRALVISQSCQTNPEAAFPTARVVINLRVILAGVSMVSRPVSVMTWSSGKNAVRQHGEMACRSDRIHEGCYA